LRPPAIDPQNHGGADLFRRRATEVLIEADADVHPANARRIAAINFAKDGEARL
jgi:hypothetical protein